MPPRDRQTQRVLHWLVGMVLTNCMLAGNYYLKLGVFPKDPRGTFFFSLGLTGVLAVYFAALTLRRGVRDTSGDAVKNERPE